MSTGSDGNATETDIPGASAAASEIGRSIRSRSAC